KVRARQEARALEHDRRSGHADEPPRDPGTVLLSAMSDADRLLQQLKAQLDAGAFDGPALQALGEWIDRAARISELLIDVGFAERQARYVDAQAALLNAGLRWYRYELGRLLGVDLIDDPRAEEIENRMLEHLAEGAAPQVPADG